MVDPLFLYAASINSPLMCVFLDTWFAAAVTALRCAVDVAHAWNLVLRVRDAFHAPAPRREEPAGDEEAAASAARPTDRSSGAARERASKKALLLDVFVILPVMQVRGL
jgi:cyclic nucleotide gated channel, plant